MPASKVTSKFGKPNAVSSSKTGTKGIAIVNKKAAAIESNRNLRSKDKSVRNALCKQATKFNTESAKATAIRRKSNIVFDEIENPQPKHKTKSIAEQKGQRVRTPIQKVKSKSPENFAEEKNAGIREKADKGTTTIHARFNEGQQVIQMTVDAQEEQLFDTASEADETESEIEDVESENSSAEEGQLDKETELDGEAEVCPSTSQSAGTNPTATQQQIDQIDYEMQQRIIDLHDKMEESGLHGAVQLIEQLFDQKPGEDQDAKQKFKRKFRSGINSKPKDRENTNQNRQISNTGRTYLWMTDSLRLQFIKMLFKRESVRHRKMMDWICLMNLIYSIILS